MTGLSMITIYYSPSDYPNLFVARRWTVEAGKATPEEGVMATADTLEEVRACVPIDYTRLPRHPDDDAVIVEVWL